MKQLILQFSLSIMCLFFSAQGFAQYGGYGGYGAGRMMGGSSMGMQEMDSGKPKPPPDPDEVAKEETRLMVKKLKLDEEQEIVISSLNEDYAYQRKDLYEAIKKEFGTNARPTPQQMQNAKERMEVLEAKKEKELEKILRPEQFKTYLEIKAKSQKNNQQKLN